MHSAASKPIQGSPRSHQRPGWGLACYRFLGQSVGSEACPAVVERAFCYVGVILTINVSFQYDWMNGCNFGTNPYLDYQCFSTSLNLSSNGYSPFTLANFAQFCPGLKHFYKQKFSNFKHLSSSYAMISKYSPYCFEPCTYILTHC